MKKIDKLGQKHLQELQTLFRSNGLSLCSLGWQKKMKMKLADNDSGIYEGRDFKA